MPNPSSQQPLVSVIVPIYNAKDHIARCVESIRRQTYRNLQILLLNDGSQDVSLEVCRMFAQVDGRITLIDKENSGVSATRNLGMRAARGAYLQFVDADDTLQPYATELLVQRARDSGADMVIAHYNRVEPPREHERARAPRRVEDADPGFDPRTRVQTFGFLMEGPLTKAEFAYGLMQEPASFYYGVMWNKLYRTAFFRETGLAYPSRVWYEDMRTTPKLLAEARQVVYLDYVGYNYFSRTGSITKNQNAARNREIVEAFDDLLPWFQRQGLFEKYRQELCYLVVYHAYLTASVRVLLIDKKHPLLGELRAYLERWFPDWRQCPYLSRMSRAHRLLLSLLGKKRYGLVALLFQLKGRLG